MGNEPHAQRRGWLKNGNPPGDYSQALRCGAKTRRLTACQGTCDAKRALPDARRDKHGAEDTQGPRAQPPGAMEAGAYSQEVRDLRALARRNREQFRTLEARGKELGLW